MVELAKDVKSYIRIVQINVEGMSWSKAQTINHFFGDADILIIQEAHVTADQTKGLNMNSFQLVNFVGHPKHGMATYVNHNVQPQYVQHRGQWSYNWYLSRKFIHL